MVVDTDDVEKVAGLFKPPGWNPSQRLKFDLAVIGAIGVITVGFGLHTAIACGYLSSFGLSGFAMASDVTAQQSQLTSIQATQVQNSIDRDRTQICQAQAQKNQSALYAWSQTLQEDISTYWQIPQIKRQPQMRPCEELIISSQG